MLPPNLSEFNKNISDNSLLASGAPVFKSIFLQPLRNRELKVVRLNAPGKVDTDFGSEKFSILDFELLQVEF
ncbi:MAG: hypothetical protein FJX80_11350 [Bacteroidetes bacterium]|nr:hypothetical protein [Bacteroidota bacterium]